jgi:hypothetical protein
MVDAVHHGSYEAWGGEEQLPGDADPFDQAPEDGIQRQETPAAAGTSILPQKTGTLT